MLFICFQCILLDSCKRYIILSIVYMYLDKTNECEFTITWIGWFHCLLFLNWKQTNHISRFYFSVVPLRSSWMKEIHFIMVCLEEKIENALECRFFFLSVSKHALLFIHCFPQFVYVYFVFSLLPFFLFLWKRTHTLEWFSYFLGNQE